MIPDIDIKIASHFVPFGAMGGNFAQWCFPEVAAFGNCISYVVGVCAKE